MKKVSLFTLALCTGMALFAQNTTGSQPQLRTPMDVKTRFGIKGGVNLAELEIDDDAGTKANTNMKTSFHGGFFVNVPLTQNLRFQPELLYSAQGSKAVAMSSTDPNLAGINEYDFHYVSLPLMVQMQTNGGFFVELGPQFSYLSSANGDRQSGGSVNLKDLNYVKKTDIAGGVGLGYLSRIGLGVSGRYTHGFSNVWNNENSSSDVKDMKFKNSVVQVGLVYQFGAYK